MRYIRNLFLMIILLSMGVGGEVALPSAGAEPAHSSHIASDRMQVSIVEDHVNCDKPCPEMHQSTDTQHHHTCPSALLCAPPIASIPSAATSEMKFVLQPVRYDLFQAQRMTSATIAPVGPPPKA